MSVESILAQGRARTEQKRFTETLRAGQVVDTTDEDTGDPVRTVVEPFIYEGPGQVKYPGTAVSDSDGTAQVVTEQSVIIKTPVGAPVVPEGAGFEVVASRVDASLVGRTYTVDGAPASGQVTSHRYRVTELT